MKKGEYIGGNKNILGRNDGEITISHEAVLGLEGMARYVGVLITDDRLCEKLCQEPKGEEVVWVYGASGSNDPEHRSVAGPVKCFMKNHETCDVMYEDLKTGELVTASLVGSEFLTDPKEHVISHDWLMSFVDRKHRVWVSFFDNSKNDSVHGSKMTTVVVTVETDEGVESRTGVLVDDKFFK
jgi:hypothetical protein